MSIAYTADVPSRLQVMRLATTTASVLLISAWGCAIFISDRDWPAIVLSTIAAFLASGAYGFNVRPKLNRLPMFGKDKVLVRSLDEWTLYQYGLLFDQTSPEQQSDALNHYKVGTRLFPARPQDFAVKQSSLHWVLMLVSSCSFLTLSQAVHGGYRALIFTGFYVWLIVCTRLSKRFSALPPSNQLTGLDLS